MKVEDVVSDKESLDVKSDKDFNDSFLDNSSSSTEEVIALHERIKT